MGCNQLGRWRGEGVQEVRATGRWKGEVEKEEKLIQRRELNRYNKG